MNQESGIKNNKTLHATRYTLHARAGFGLLEVLVAGTIIMVSLVALVGASQASFRVIADNSRRTQAEFLAEEGIEIARIVRDESWSQNIAPLSRVTSFFPIFTASTNRVALQATSPGPIDGIFSREVILYDVYRRNSDNAIVPVTSTEPKTVDAGTREVASRVFWGDGKEVEIRTYLTDLFLN